MFPERDESSGLGVLKQIGENQLRGNAQYQTVLKEIGPQLEYDRVFAEKLRNRAVVLGYYFSDVVSEDGKGRATGAVPKPVLAAGTFKGRNIAFTRWIGYGANLPEFQEATASGGHFNPLPDEDGVTRRVPMLAEYEGAYYESLSMAMVAWAGFSAGRHRISGGKGSGTIRTGWIDIGLVRIPGDVQVAALVPYRGHQGAVFKYVSATDVLHGKAPSKI